MLETVQLPALVTRLNTGLTQMNRDTFFITSKVRYGIVVDEMNKKEMLDESTIRFCRRKRQSNTERIPQVNRSRTILREST